MPGRDHTEHDRRALAECAESVAIAIEWLEQGLTAFPADRHDALAGTIGGLLGEARAVHAAAALVCGHGEQNALARFFAADAPLHVYLAEVYAWTTSICDALDEIMVAVRRGDPARTIFLHRAINASYARLEGALRNALAHLGDHVETRMGGEATPPFGALDADLEELLWATTWLHLSLTKRFGE